MITCQEVAAQVGEYLDGRTNYRQRAAIWVHFLICGPCRRYYEQMQTVSAVVKSAEDARPEEQRSPAPPVRDELIKAYRKSQQQLQAQASVEPERED